MTRKMKTYEWCLFFAIIFLTSATFDRRYVRSSSISLSSCPEYCRCSTDENNVVTANCSRILPESGAFFNVQQLTLTVPSSSTPIDEYSALHYIASIFPHLKYLYLSRCGLAHLSRNSFKRLSSLKEISLADNRLKEFSTQLFFSNRKLLYVNLRNNPLRLKAGKSLLTSKTIVELDLSRCNLTDVPLGTFDGLPNLRYLRLENNALITVYTNSLPSAVRTIDLSRNAVVNVPIVELLRLKMLREIDLSENPINCTCELMGFQNWISGQGAVFSNNIVCWLPTVYRGWKLLHVPQYNVCEATLSSKSSCDDNDAICDNSIAPIVGGSIGPAYKTKSFDNDDDDDDSNNNNNNNGRKKTNDLLLLDDGPDAIYENDEMLPVPKKSNKRHDKSIADEQVGSGDGVPSSEDDDNFTNSFDTTGTSSLSTSSSTDNDFYSTSSSTSEPSTTAFPNLSMGVESANNSFDVNTSASTPEQVVIEPNEQAKSDDNNNGTTDTTASVSSTYHFDSTNYNNDTTTIQTLTDNKLNESSHPQIQPVQNTPDDRSSDNVSSSTDSSSIEPKIQHSLQASVDRFDNLSLSTSTENLTDNASNLTASSIEPQLQFNQPSVDNDTITDKSSSSSSSVEAQTQTIEVPNKSNNELTSVYTSIDSTTTVVSSYTSVLLPDMTISNETAGSAIKTVGSVNETVGFANETVGSVNEKVGSVNETVSAIETVGSAIETVGSANETVGSANETAGSANETILQRIGEGQPSERMELFGYGLTYVIPCVVVIVFILVLCVIVYTSRRRKSFRKSYSLEDNNHRTNEGTELQDVSLLSQNAKRVRDDDNVADNKYPNENPSEQTVRLINDRCEDEILKPSSPIWPRTPNDKSNIPSSSSSSSNSSSSTLPSPKAVDTKKPINDEPDHHQPLPNGQSSQAKAPLAVPDDSEIEVAKAKLITLPDSVPKTAVLIDRNSMIDPY